MKDFGRVAVLMGGFSSERAVSLHSGKAVLEALKRRGIDAYPFDPAVQPLLKMKEENFQVAFNVLHGTFGEDGVVQGVLEALNIPYTGCGVTASAIGMNKHLTRLIWQGHGLPNVPYMILQDDSDFAAIEHQLGLPLFIKPSAEGSSVGVSKIEQPGQLQVAYEALKQQNLHGEILVERAIMGGEYTCALLGDRALPSVHIIPQVDFYDYEAKYQRDDTLYLCPSDLSIEEEQCIQNLAKSAFYAIGGRSWGRIDFLRDKQGKFYLLEVNTVPGMTSHSLVPKAAEQIGLNFDELCVEILNHATLG